MVLTICLLSCQYLILLFWGALRVTILGLAGFYFRKANLLSARIPEILFFSNGFQNMSTKKKLIIYVHREDIGFKQKTDNYIVFTMHYDIVTVIGCNASL